MAKEQVAEPIEETSVKTRGRRKNLVVVGILLGVMLAEGLTVFVLAKRFGPQPGTAEAGGIGGLDPEEGRKRLQEVEVEVARFRAQNEQARQVVVYDVAVCVTVSQDNEETFKGLIEQKRNTIQDRLSSVIRAADPKVLTEPDRSTLRQQFRQELIHVVGDEEVIREVLIPSMVSYREG